MKKSLLIIFAIIFTFANAEGVTPFSSVEQKRRVFSVIAKTQEDTRIDFNQDKRIDYWKIKKGQLAIEAYYKGGLVYYHIRKFEKGAVIERLVLQNGLRLKLVSSANRKQHVYHYSAKENECFKQELKTVSSIIEDLQKASIDTQACIQNFTSEECFSRDNNQVFNSEIEVAIANVFKLPDNSPVENNKALSCFKDSRVKNLFISRFGKEDGEVEFEKSLIGLKNSLIKFSKMQDGGVEPVIRCKQTTEPNPKPPMKFSEAGQIQILIKKNGESYAPSEIEQQLFHENLHSSSITDEELTQAVTELCYKNKVTALAPLGANSASNTNSAAMAPAQLNNFFQANTTQAKEVAMEIPRSVEAPLPPPTNASPVDMNRVAAIESTERVQSISNSQTSGIVRMAESVLAATPAVAAPATTGLAATTSGSSNSRLPASTYTTSTSVPAAKLVGKQNSSGLKAGEYIKEEIDLTKQTTTTNTRVAASTNEKPTAAAAGKKGPVVSTATDIPATPEMATGGSGGASRRSTGPSLSAPSSGSRSPQRGMASSGSAVSQTEFAKSKAGLVTQLSATSDYRKTRAQLDSAEFTQSLKENSITVYNLQGKTWGAKKGDIIFLDQGDRFVREK